MEASGQRHALPLREEPLVLFEYNTGSPNSWYVSCGIEETLLPLAGIESNKLDITWGQLN